MNQVWTKYLPEYLRARIHGRLTLQRIIANSGWLLADRVFRAVVGLLVGVWSARYLGPEDFGLLNYAIAFVSLFSAISALGLADIVVRDVVKEPEARDEILGTAFVLRLTGATIALLFVAVSIATLRPDEPYVWLLVLVIAFGALFQSFDTIDFWFQSRIKSKYAVYAKSAGFVIIAAIKVVLIILGAPLISFALAASAELAITAIVLIAAYRANGNYMKSWRFSSLRAKQTLKAGWPLALSGLAIYIQARVDQVMLGEMIGAAEVGQYSVAMGLIDAFAFLPVIIQSSIAPTVTKAKAKGERHYWERLTNVYRLMFILFLATALPIYLFSESIVLFLYGQAYAEAGSLLSLFAARLFFANFGVAKNLFITNDSMFWHALLGAVAGSVVNVGLNYWLIPAYASTGAVAATIASFFVTIFVIDVFSRRARTNLVAMITAICSPWKFNVR